MDKAFRVRYIFQYNCRLSSYLVANKGVLYFRYAKETLLGENLYCPAILLLCVISSTTLRFYRILPIAVSSSRFTSITLNSYSFAREN